MTSIMQQNYLYSLPSTFYSNVAVLAFIHGYSNAQVTTKIAHKHRHAKFALMDILFLAMESKT